MKNRYSLFFFSLLVLCSVFPSNAQDKLKRMVPKIISFDSLGNELNTGAGLIVGYEQDVLFLITAYHVVQDAAKIELQLFENEWKTRIADVFRVNETDDLAVLTIRGIQLDGNLKVFSGTDKSIKAGKRIIQIGHPIGNSWKVNRQNSIDNVHLGPNYFPITKDAITDGCSGGPVFRGNNWIGILLETNGIYARCLTFSAILNMLDQDQWRVPHNLIRDGKNQNLWLWGGGILAGLGLATWAVIHMLNGSEDGPGGSSDGLPRPPHEPE